MSKVTYAQLNIGRNVGSEPMPHAQWAWFVGSAQNALAEASRVASDAWAKPCDTQVMYGRGEWQGMGEDAAYVSLYWEDGIDVAHLREQAAIMASMFDQDAIALVVGSELIAANPWDTVVAVGSDMPRTY